MQSNNISNQIFTTSINIKCNHIKGNINKLILLVLKKKFEGKCNNHGFILEDSIEILNRSIGEVKTINNTSYIIYNIKYKTDILSVSNKDTIECYINSITKMGIIGYIKITDEMTIKNSPFIIIVPNEYLPDNLDNYKINDKINVIVEAYRIKFKSTHIHIVSKLA